VRLCLSVSVTIVILFAWNTKNKQWNAAPGIFIEGGGARAQGLKDESPAMGPRGEAPVGDLRDLVPQKLKQFCSGYNF